MTFEPRVALASLSGESDAEWARAAAEHVGAAFLGGIAVDEATRAAAREMVERDREEFLPDDPVAFVDDQLVALADAPLRPGVNVRSATLPPLREVARVCAERGAILEVNAHCRQGEMCAAGTGEALLADPDRLCEQVRAAADAGATVSVKVRTEVAGVDLTETARRVVDAGADVVHVDAMDSEAVVADVVDSVGRRSTNRSTGESSGRRETTAATVIANNGVRDAATTREYLAHGADAVSVGRASDRPDVLRTVRDAVTAWFADAARANGESAATEFGDAGGER